MQVDLDQLFTLLDRTVHAVETGTVPKADVATALEAYLKVGEPGAKTRERFDSLMQALDADQEGPVVNYKKLFEEDREFNQGGQTPPPPPSPGNADKKDFSGGKLASEDIQTGDEGLESSSAPPAFPPPHTHPKAPASHRNKFQFLPATTSVLAHSNLRWPENVPPHPSQ